MQPLHGVEVLQAEVPQLCAPAQEEAQQARHGGEVTHTNVRDVAASTTEGGGTVRYIFFVRHLYNTLLGITYIMPDRIFPFRDLQLNDSNY